MNFIRPRLRPHPCQKQMLVAGDQVISKPRDCGECQCLIVIIQIEYRSEVDGAEVSLLELPVAGSGR